MPPLYLDANASCPPCAEAMAAMRRAESVVGNPASSNNAGERARAILETARAQVARVVGVQPECVVFTGGATEANNTILRGAIDRWRREHPGVKPRAVTTAIEHSSVLEPLRAAEARGDVELVVVDVDRLGRVDPEAIVHAATVAPTAVVSVQHANNEIGTIQPVEAIARMLPRDVLLHCDASQSFGRMELGPVGVLTVSSHKLGGPGGVGAMVIPRHCAGRFDPLLLGGTHEGGLRAGTPNFIGAAGFGAACDAMARRWPLGIGYDAGDRRRVRVMRDFLLACLRRELGDDIVVLNGAIDDPSSPLASLRLPHNLNVTFRGVCPASLHNALRPAMSVSAAAACRSMGGSPSHVLQAIGAPEDGAAVRFGFMPEHDEACVAFVCRTVSQAVRNLHGQGCAIPQRK